MAYETIIVDVENHVALITLNRPDALNALNAQLLGELADAMTACQANDKVRCIVLTGSEKAFAAGVDAYLSGEVSEPTILAARELGIHYIAAGHHATERYGIQAVAKNLAGQFDLYHRFIDIDNPA